MRLPVRTCEGQGAAYSVLASRGRGLPLRLRARWWSLSLPRVLVTSPTWSLRTSCGLELEANFAELERGLVRCVR